MLVLILSLGEVEVSVIDEMRVQALSRLFHIDPYQHIGGVRLVLPLGRGIIEPATADSE